ncbi:DAD/Ost2 [Corchorus capsularis]|uniref:Dolichyl-diphosphooligosaccharide--protein glycosyltransferase subunit DAD1 n=1 Tax=Corchorus capsularis TaxID=210143 RepID=A0A1R3I476_COCAP|nr:DAD/Ost2 [Corchorus capsularis]
MGKSSSSKDAQALLHSLRSAYAATPVNLKIIDLYVGFAVFTALIQVVYMAIVGSFPFNSFLSGVLSCVGTAVLAVCLRIQVNKENKEFKAYHKLNVDCGIGLEATLAATRKNGCDVVVELGTEL